MHVHLTSRVPRLERLSAVQTGPGVYGRACCLAILCRWGRATASPLPSGGARPTTAAIALQRTALDLPAWLRGVRRALPRPLICPRETRAAQPAWHVVVGGVEIDVRPAGSEDRAPGGERSSCRSAYTALALTAVVLFCPPQGCSAAPHSDDNLFVWAATVLVRRTSLLCQHSRFLTRAPRRLLCLQGPDDTSWEVRSAHRSHMRGRAGDL